MDDSSVAEPNLGWAERHVPLLASVAVFALVVVKVLRVAHGDIATAVAIVQAAGPANVLLGVSTTLLPVLLVVTVLLLGAYVAVVRESWNQHLTIITAFVLFAFMSLLFLPTRLLLLLVAALIIQAGLIVLLLSARSVRTRSYYVVLALVVAAPLFLVPSAPWLPAEAISLRGEDPNGFVVDNPARGRESDVLHYPVVLVVSRTVCTRPNPLAGNSLIGRFLGEFGPLTPECPVDTGGFSEAIPESGAYRFAAGEIEVVGTLEVASGSACTTIADPQLVWFDSVGQVVAVAFLRRPPGETPESDSDACQMSYDVVLPVAELPAVPVYHVEIPGVSLAPFFITADELVIREGVLDLVLDTAGRLLPVTSYDEVQREASSVDH